MRIPSNVITKNQYTAGKEYVYLATYKEYIGYYYVINGKYFTGKTYNSDSSSLELAPIKKSENTNLFLTQAATYIYGLLSKKNSKELSSPKFNSIIAPELDTNNKEETETYYVKKLNTIPILIKQVDKKTFQSLKPNPLYQVTSLKLDYSNIDEAEKQMPGLKAFLNL